MVFIAYFFSFPVLLFRCLFSPRFSPFHDVKVVQLVEVCKALCAGMKNILSSKAVRYFSFREPCIHLHAAALYWHRKRRKNSGRE